jgi:N-hydroxyarylamine O-acetyltransferase
MGMHAFAQPTWTARPGSYRTGNTLCAISSRPAGPPSLRAGNAAPPSVVSVDGSDPMEEAQVNAYLARIGVDRPVGTDAEALRRLQLNHLLAVPFENLSIQLGERIQLDEAALLDKLVTRRRGGFCYELNGAFAALLSALGFAVSLLGARVFGADGGLGPPFDHLALRVDLAEPWLVDVGFGRFCHHPVRLAVRADQPDPAGTVRVLDREDGDLDVVLDGAPQYRLEAHHRTLADFEPTCWWQQTSPTSHFTQNLVCSMLTETGRVTLSDHTLVQTRNGVRDELGLADDAEVLAAYRTNFGIALDRVPSVRRP